ncbi:thymidylate kinase [Amanita rubescens]|nr:thymidylate kinase [Amanita rubescens]
MTNIKRGAFIVIEGLDRSGKSTQSSAILARLHEHGIPAKLIKFPDRTTPIGKMIDAYLRSQSDLDDRAIHLLFSANRWELATSIQQTLTASLDADTTPKPTILLADRYAFSGIAFSHAKGLPYTWCRAPDISLPSPDLTLFLDISPEHARKRGGYGQERYEKEEMQKRVREDRGGAGDVVRQDRLRWITIDASRSIEQVTNEIWTAIEPLIHGTSEPLGRLWTTDGDSG